jgi:hypothetical protein
MPVCQTKWKALHKRTDMCPQPLPTWVIRWETLRTNVSFSLSGCLPKITSLSEARLYILPILPPGWCAEAHTRQRTMEEEFVHNRVPDSLVPLVVLTDPFKRFYVLPSWSLRPLGRPADHLH